MTRRIHSEVGSYYSGKLRAFGATPKGVDWNDRDSQLLRFQQLHRLFETEPGATVADLGCGYGELLDYLRDRDHHGAYTGVDISEDMIEAATSRHRNQADARFQVGSVPSKAADYVVSSGIFNVRLNFATPDWEQYIKMTLDSMAQAGRMGFAFNCLTSYSDPEFQRNDLYYGDPCYWFDHCKRSLSRKVSILHDYDLYEFTVLVRK